MPQSTVTEESIVTVPQQTSIKTAVINFLEKDNWNFEQSDNCIQISYVSENSTYDCFLDISEGNNSLSIYSYISVKIPVEKRLSIAEYITRANSGLILGNLEMLFSNGLIRYKTSIAMLDGELTYKMLGHLLWRNFEAIDYHFPGIMSVIYGNTSPEDVIRQMESEDDIEKDTDNN